VASGNASKLTSRGAHDTGGPRQRRRSASAAAPVPPHRLCARLLCVPGQSSVGASAGVTGCSATKTVSRGGSAASKEACLADVRTICRLQMQRCTRTALITILAEAYCVLFVIVRRIWVNFLRPCARVNHQTTYLLNRTPAPPGFEKRQHSCRYCEERFEYERCGRREKEVAPRSAAIDVREPARLRLGACECSGELRIHMFAQGCCKGSRQHSSQRQHTVVR
jgi:hypothetical protein